MIKKFFMACEEGGDDGEHYGPFDTAQEAETQAMRLGWEWVGVYADDGDQVVAVRFYQLGGTGQDRKAGDVAALHRMAVPAAMNEDEIRFFAEYEEQMASVPVQDVKRVDWRKNG